jgi:hypothetical protein
MTANKLASVLVLLSSTLLAQPVTVPALGPRFKQTRERIDSLFQQRDPNRSLPDQQPTTNLFRPLLDSENSRPVPSTQATSTEPREDIDETVLNQALLILKKGGGGIVTVMGRTHLTYNQKIYKEGDYISVALGDRLRRILIRGISTNSVTLALHDSQVVWRF